LAVEMMAEGSETPNGEQGSGPEGRPRRSEGDLLAERRARRAAESGEVALTRRAEAAEATVQTLERHVSSLQQRMREAEDDRLRMDELLEAERDAALEREHELRRVKQREYAEQQLRVEAEDRLLSVDRESRVEIERLGARLSASEDDARELARRLEGVQRQLAEVEQEALAERATVLADRRSRAERDLQVRLADLERRALEIQSGLDAERAARERSERLLESMRSGHRRMELLLGELKGIVARVSTVLTAEDRSQLVRSGVERSEIHRPPVAGPASEARGAEMADALAAAVERLRARAEATALVSEEATALAADEAVPMLEKVVPAPGGAAARAPATRTPPTRDQTVQGPPVERATPSAPRVPHKHSLSWFARRRNKRKQRRGG
jgi:chromosome segregation ATPase